MGLAKVLGEINGIVIGTVMGLAVYVGLAGDGITAAGFLSAIWDVGGLAVGAAGSGIVLSYVRVYPLAPIYAGIIGGIVGGVLGFYLSPALSIPNQVFGGFIAMVVMGILLRFLPGL